MKRPVLASLVILAVFAAIVLYALYFFDLNQERPVLRRSEKTPITAGPY